jgi:uncharacterized membrane protein
MLLAPLLLLHICSATVGLLSGFMAMAFRKGSGLHGAAGTVFFVSMLCASSTGASIAAFMKPNSANLMVSVLVIYLVATAWVAARRRDGKAGIFDLVALLCASAIGAAGAIWGFEAASGQSGSKDGYPSAFYFAFGSIALLFAVSDARMVVRGGVFGAKRIARHLWRMCLALLLATLAFLPRLRVSELLPEWFRGANLHWAPSVLVIGAMLFWLYRVSMRKRVPQNKVTDVRHGAIVTRLVGATGPA